MSFTATWMNQLEQFGRVDITLLVVDDDSIVPTARIEKSYPAVSVTENFLEQQAEAELNRIIAEWNAQGLE